MLNIADFRNADSFQVYISSLAKKNIDGILSVHIKLSLPNIYIFPYCYLKVRDFISHSEDVGLKKLKHNYGSA